MSNEPEEAGRTRPFADVLTEMQRGKTHRELSTGLQELIEAVVDTHRAGSITLTIKVSKSKGGRNVVELDDKVSVKMPAPDRDSSIFFVTSDHNLVRDDPDQLQFPVGPVRVADDVEGKAAGE